ncbi:hypothetical protein GCM10028801_41220 [Nocardioides maradonensis]
MKFTVEVFGDRAMQMFRDIADRAEGRPALDMLGEVLVAYEHVIFDSSNRGRWRRLSPDTVREKHSSRVLIDSGLLMKSLTGRPRVGEDEVALFSDVAYAKYVKKGRKPGKNGKKVPGRNPAPRPPRPVTDQWSRILVDYIADGR